jgi:two-component system sensor histidine kinase PilS (NtrC family)
MKPLLASDAPADYTELAWRVLALVNLFRLLAATILTVIFLAVSPTRIGQTHPALFIGASTAYFAYAVLMMWSVRRRWPDADVQTVVNVCVDVVVITLFAYSSGGMASGLGSLLVLPIGAAAVVMRPRVALMLAAIAAIALLGQQVLISLTTLSEASDFTSAGIVGALLFIVTLGVGPLARNLREGEERVRQREVDVANLAELNQFIVQHLRESILVVDAQDTIRLINESAAMLLKGSSVEPGTPLGEVSPRLLHLLNAWRQYSQDWQLRTTTLLAWNGAAIVQPHFVSLNLRENGPTLIFLEDTSVIIERVQQSKLAALGRLSASIAHEIRNPVGAMSHAAQLLAEAPNLNPQERRLTDIIRSNGERVSTIIDNVLQLSRREATRQERIELNGWLSEFLAEFRQTLQADEQAVRQLPSAEDVEVYVDPSHLHQILWNLCENALKYGRDAAGAACVELRTGRIAISDRPFLEVMDRGPGITNSDADRIFEPFFTAGQGGTGLGLFISRELAQSNRAVLVYEPRIGGGSIFRIVFADPQRWEAS